MDPWAAGVGDQTVVVGQHDLSGVSQVEERAVLGDYFHGDVPPAPDLLLTFGRSGASPDYGAAGHGGGE